MPQPKETPEALPTVLQVCLEYGSLTLNDLGRISASHKYMYDEVKVHLRSEHRLEARELILHTALNVGMDMSELEASKHAQGIKWLIETAGVTRQMMSDDSMALLKTPKVHKVLIEVRESGRGTPS